MGVGGVRGDEGIVDLGLVKMYTAIAIPIKIMTAKIANIIFLFGESIYIGKIIFARVNLGKFVTERSGIDDAISVESTIRSRE